MLGCHLSSPPKKGEPSVSFSVCIQWIGVVVELEFFLLS